MIIFQHLRPFVFLCQLSGLIPFSMETNRHTKKFKQFSFSWKKPAAWWFTILSIVFLIYIILNLFYAWELFFNKDILEIQIIPLLFRTFIFVEHIDFFIMVLTSRLITFKYCHLRRVVCLLKKVHKEFNLQNLPLDNFMPKVKRQVTCGIILIFSCVSDFLIVLKFKGSLI